MLKCFYFHIFENLEQIWLNGVMHDHHLGHITKLKKETLANKLQAITFKFSLISDLLVSTRYHAGLSLAWWFHNSSLLGWKFHNHYSLHGWKRWHPHSHKGWLCLVTSSSMLVTMNSWDILECLWLATLPTSVCFKNFWL